VVVDYDEVLLDAAAGLQPLPTSVLELITVSARADTEIDQVVGILEADPTLLAHVLREANSVGLGARGTVATAQDAVVRLGTGRVAAIAVLTSVGDVFEQPLDPYKLGAGDFGNHAFLALSGATEVRNATKGLLPNEITTACVLHDIGKLVIAATLREVDHALFERIDEFAVDWTTIERDLVGVDHGEVGRVILEQWNLPSSIASAVQYHHRPDQGDSLLAYGVALVDGLVHRVTDPDRGLTAEAELSAEKLGIGSDALTMISAAIVPAVSDKS